MNRKEFIDKLRINLQGMPAAELQDILSDYEEHFDIGLSKGKTEEEISKELGDPRDIADGYKSSFKSSYNDNSNTASYNPSNDGVRKALIIALLVGFNLIVILGPYMALIGILLGIYGVSIGLIFGGIGLLLGIPLSFFNFIPNLHIITTLSFSVGLGALGVLGIILAVILTKFIYQITVKYINWNIELVNK